MNYILSWWKEKHDKKPKIYPNPMLGDIVCIKKDDEETWFYVLGRKYYSNKILVSRADNNFKDIFESTLKLDINENVFLYVGSPENSPLQLSDKFLRHSQTVKKNWYNEVDNCNKKEVLSEIEGWYLDEPEEQVIKK